MTAIGKLLVFLNLIVGTAILSWAVGVYTQRVEWIDRTPEGGEKIEGEITRLRAEIERQAARAALATREWGPRYKALAAYEPFRDQRQAEFARRLAEARTGAAGFREQLYLPDPADPAKTLSLLDTAKEGNPVKGPPGDKPLQGVVPLEATYEANRKEAERLAKESYDLVKASEALGREAEVTRLRVDKQKAVYEELLDEARFLEAFEVNWYEQLVTTQRRKAQLENRLKADYPPWPAP